MSENRQKISFQAARAAFLRGENVSENLRRQLGVDRNTPEIIETAYDLQAGSYIKFAEENSEYIQKFTTELASVLNRYLKAGDSLLDAGTGEMTTLSALANQLPSSIGRLLAFDLSWSRLHHGDRFARKSMTAEIHAKLDFFAADISAVPLASDSVDVVMTVHALEPNGGREQTLLKELLRVAHRHVILFEPGYEINSPEGKARMENLGYIRDLPGVIDRLGVKLLEKILLKTVANPLNPTVAYVIEVKSNGARNENLFSDPGSDSGLVRLADGWFSPERGVTYPIIGGIPILRENAAILTSALADN
jgi:ubiquinone/menaquinone biosynthesis C-methylase UbiE